MTQWRGGVGTADCTPAPGTVLGGGAFAAAHDCLDPLLASAVVLEAGEQRLVLLAVDCLGLTNDDADRLRRRLALRAGVTPASVLVAASHTHGAAATLDLAGWGPRNLTAVALIERACMAALDQALAELRPLRVRLRQTTITDLADPRSRYSEGIDPSLIALELVDDADHCRAMLVNWGCHPVFFHGCGMFTADLAGALRRACRAACGEQALACFLMGAAGDVNPRGCGQWPDLAARRLAASKCAERLIAALLSAPAVELAPDIDSREEWFALPRQVMPSAAACAEALSILAAETTNEPWAASAVLARRSWYEQALAGTLAAPSLHLAWHRLGSVNLLAMDAECFGAIGRRLRQALAGPALLATVCNGYAGYLCTAQAVNAGNFEALLVAQMLQVRPFAADAGEQLIAHVAHRIHGRVPRARGTVA